MSFSDHTHMLELLSVDPFEGASSSQMEELEKNGLAQRLREFSQERNALLSTLAEKLGEVVCDPLAGLDILFGMARMKLGLGYLEDQVEALGFPYGRSCLPELLRLDGFKRMEIPREIRMRLNSFAFERNEILAAMSIALGKSIDDPLKGLAEICEMISQEKEQAERLKNSAPDFACIIVNDQKDIPNWLARNDLEYLGELMDHDHSEPNILVIKMGEYVNFLDGGPFGDDDFGTDLLAVQMYITSAYEHGKSKNENR